MGVVDIGYNQDTKLYRAKLRHFNSPESLGKGYSIDSALDDLIKLIEKQKRIYDCRKIEHVSQIFPHLQVFDFINLHNNGNVADYIRDCKLHFDRTVPSIRNGQRIFAIRRINDNLWLFPIDTVQVKIERKGKRKVVNVLTKRFGCITESMIQTLFSLTDYLPPYTFEFTDIESFGIDSMYYTITEGELVKRLRALNLTL